MIIGPLYHWSPVTRRQLILKEGLAIYAPPVVHSGALVYPYLCFAPSPAMAWGLSGGSDPDVQGEFSWDLWQVRVAGQDTVDVLGFFGDEIREVRVRNSIPPDRVWFVATREDGQSGLGAK